MFFFSANCPAGTFKDDRIDSCVDCPSATYQDRENSLACSPCPKGYTTYNKRSKSLADCKGSLLFLHTGRLVLKLAQST